MTWTDDEINDFAARASRLGARSLDDGTRLHSLLKPFGCQRPHLVAMLKAMGVSDHGPVWPYERGTAIVPIRNDNHHNYPLGVATLLMKDGYTSTWGGLRADSADRGNYLRLRPGDVREATVAEAEIIIRIGIGRGETSLRGIYARLKEDSTLDASIDTASGPGSLLAALAERIVAYTRESFGDPDADEPLSEKDIAIVAAIKRFNTSYIEHNAIAKLIGEITGRPQIAAAVTGTHRDRKVPYAYKVGWCVIARDDADKDVKERITAPLLIANLDSDGDARHNHWPPGAYRFVSTSHIPQLRAATFDETLGRLEEMFPFLKGEASSGSTSASEVDTAMVKS